MHIVSQLLNVPSVDPDDARRRRLLNVLLLSIAAPTFLILLTGVIADVADGGGFFQGRTSQIYLICLGTLIGLAIIFALNCWSPGWLASSLFLLLTTTVSVLVAMAEGSVAGHGVLLFTLPVVMASVLLRPYASLIVAGLGSLLLVVAAVSLPSDLNLSAILIFFSLGAVSWLAVGSLERTLGDLRAANRELDRHSVEQTQDQRRRSVQLQTASEVVRDATAILSVEQLLNATARLISDKFGFYHAGIFLLDERGEHAILKAASSEGGQRLLERGYRLEVGSGGIVGHVAGTGKPRIAVDVGQDAIHAANPDLPDTRSEMALPLVRRGLVIGVLDVQSAKEEAFTDQDVATLHTMADQLAIAIDNARLFEAAERRWQEAETLHWAAQSLATTLDLHQVFECILSELRQVVPYDSATVQLLRGGQLEIIGGRGFPNLDKLLGMRFDVSSGDNPNSEVMRRQAPFIVDDAPAVYPEFRKDPHAAAGIRSWLGVPLVFHDQFIGMLALDKREAGFYTSEHARLASAFAIQAAIAIENARLFEGARRHAEELGVLHNIDLAITSTLDLDQVLQAIYEQVSEVMEVTTFYIGLYDDKKQRIQLPFVVDDGKRVPQITVDIGEDGGLSGWVVRNRQSLFVADLQEEQDDLPVEAVHKGTPARSLMICPLVVRDKVVGVISAQSYESHAFDEEHRRLFSGIAGQVAIAVGNARLYQRLEDQANELARAYDELQEIDRLRTQLVQNVSHELRTPLGLIKGYVELLLAGDLGPVLESQQAALEVVRDRTATLSRLIHNLMMLQAVPREALALVPVSVVEIVRDVLMEFRRPAEEGGITLREKLPDNLPPVLGDRERLELVFGHLVDNAVKFSPDGGAVTLRAWAGEHMVFVSISDEGIGIAPGHLERVFERFYQVDGSTKRRFGGMGVGLALVWEIVEAHGGSVRVESQPEVGSTFTILLPRANGTSGPDLRRDQTK